MNKKIFALFAVLIFSFGLIWTNSTKAGVSTTQGMLVERLKAGKLIEPGEYVGEKLNNEEADYYKIKVKPGQQIRIHGTGEAGNEWQAEKLLRFTLYNEEGTILSRNSLSPYLDSAKAETMSVFYLPGTTEIAPQTKTNLAFLEVYLEKGNETYWLKGYSFSLTLDKEKTDIGSGTDVGDDFNFVQEIEIGDYPENFLAKNECGSGKYCSTDHKDLYKISVKGKEKLTVKITPNSNLQTKIDFFNELKEIQKEGKASTDKGVVIEASYLCPKDQNVYFAISDAFLGDYYYGSYAMNVAVKTATAEELKEAGIKEEVPEEVVFEEEKPEVIEEEPIIIPEEVVPKTVEVPLVETFLSQIKSALIWWVAGFVVFIAIMVTVIILVKKAKKRPPKPPVPPVPPTSTFGPFPPTRETLTLPEALKPKETKPTRPGMILPPKELKGK